MEGVDAWVRKWAEINRDGVALTTGDRQLTWADLDRRVDALAHLLKERGIAPGDRVGCLMNNSPEFLDALYATSRLGAIFTPLNIRYAAPELDFAVQHAGISLILTEEAFRPLITEAGADVDLLWTSQWPEPRPDLRVDPAGSWADDGFLLFTSGTTGTPRAVLHAQEALLWGSMDAVMIHGYRSEDKLVTALPLCYTGGLNVATSLAHAGAELILADSADPQHLLGLIERHHATIFHGVPTMCERLVASENWPRADLSSLRLARTGGAPVSAALMEAFAARGVPLTQGYGLTESGGTGLTLPAREARHYGKTGRPTFCVEAKVVDPETGAEVAPDQVGEILLRGRQIMRGYWNEPEATAGTLRDGWLWTGDLGSVDPEGLFTITGRSKDLIVTGGLNVYPAEVEHVLTRLEGILEAAVIGLPSQRWGEEVAAVVVAGGSNVPEQEIIEHCRRHLADYKCPKRVVFVQGPLPRTASGKVVKRELASYVSARG
ncbi:hypothetical protein BHE97_08735 [Aeromicrobium sp. PE09-221]|uniref:class I adenylate-forming enzyme family protein n=1 Tax=Aeromicrobium sp. PE09-221 TaxID=1898043 RepID=UPI000B67FD59|nr:AMP-binding protein [Aeromicrobium sp. PE09-221]OUZ10131.1 hypothetical protein BHE97_08735 [Aeromicrobium sp. PE09-221]